MTEWASFSSLLGRSSEEGIPDNHVVTVTERSLSVDIPELIQNNIKTDTVTLELDAEWDGISPVIIFECSDADYQVQYEGSPAHIPQAVMKSTGSVGLSVCGYDDTGEIRLVTKAAPSTFTVVASGSFIGEISEDDVSLLGQILAAAEAANEAAQKVATASFSMGTVTTLEPGEQASASLDGEGLQKKLNLSIPKGAKGDPGDKGDQGDQGDKGDQGDPGYTPQRGVDYWTAEDVEAVVEDAKAQAVAELAEIGNVPKRTVTDLVAHGEDAYAQKPIEVRVKGKTWANRWPYKETITIGGITVSMDSTGLMTVSGTATEEYITIGPAIGVAPNKTYTIAVSSLPANVIVLADSYSSENKWLSSISVRSGTTAIGTTHADMGELRCLVHVTKDATVNASFRVMLVEGDTAPDCFVPTGLHSVEPTNLVTSGKNLLRPRPDLAQSTTYGVTFTPQDDGGILVNGTSAGSDGSYYNIDFDPAHLSTAPGTDISAFVGSEIVVSGNGGNVNISSVFKSIDDATTQPSGTVDGNAAIVPAGAVRARTYIFVNTNDTVNNVTVYPQLELGSTATAYEPPNVTTTPLPEVELRGLPDGTCDELVIKADGTCEVERRTQLVDGEVVALDTPTTEPQSPVTLPQLPAPTFNAYSDADIPSDTSVEYARDINLVLANLEAVQAALLGGE